MNKILGKLTLVFTFILAMVLITQPIMATSIAIPGNTPEEQEIVRLILASTDEAEVFSYLTDERPVIRMVACQRLGDIGTSYSLSKLMDMAVNDEDIEAREEASFSLWKIRYREADNPEDLLLSIINIYTNYTTGNIDKEIAFDQEVPNWFIPRDDGGNWFIENGEYKQSAQGYDLHMSIMDGVIIENGTIQAKINLNGQNHAAIGFRIDEEGNGYVAEILCYEEIPGLYAGYLGLWKMRNWSANYGANPEIIGKLISDFDPYGTYTFKVEASNASIKVFVNIGGEVKASITASDNEFTSGKVALGTFGVQEEEVSFDDVSIHGTGLVPVRDYSDVTKTSRVLGWAMELLGDMGSTQAIPLLENFISDTEPAPDLLYLQEIAAGSLKLIDFITTHQPMTLEAIEEGLQNAELRIKIWCLKELIKLNPPDLIERLEALLQTAEANNDYEFLLHISQALEKLREPQPSPIIIVYPPNGAIVKTSSIKVFGYVNNEPFSEIVDLVLGENIYTKEATDPNGNTVSVSITITRIPNEPPVLEPIGNKQVLAGQTLTFTINATDPDDSPEELLYFVFDLPDGATFDYTIHTFSWTPQEKDIGTYTVTFEVQDGNGGGDSEVVTITVESGENRPPDISAIPSSITKNEGQTLSKAEIELATDPDGDPLAYAYSGWISSLPYTIGYQEAGPHTLHVEVSDGKEPVGKDVAITVNNVNRPPVFDPIPITFFTVTEGETVTFGLHATDPDGDKVLFGYGYRGTKYFTFTSSQGAGQWERFGTFTWNTAQGQAGTYQFWFYASDRKVISPLQYVTIRINSRPPSGPNLVSNPGMEQGTTVPLEWYTYSNTLTNQTGWVTETALSGTHSIKIVNPTGVNAGWYGKEIVFTEPYPTTIKFGGWSKAQEVQLTSSSSLYCLDFRVEFTDGSVLWFFPAELKFSPGTPDWQNREIQKSWGKPIKKIRPYCLIYQGATGTAWFDDIYVYRVD